MQIAILPQPAEYLGALIGYNKIPAYWKQGLTEAEGINFKYTSMSLNTVYDVSLKHAMENIRRHGGKTGDDKIVIRMEKPKPVKFEKSFDGVFPVTSKPVQWNTAKDEATFEFEGIGFVIRGDASEWNSQSDYVFQADITIDGKKESTVLLPVNFTTRRYDLAWKYDLAPGKHSVSMHILNPSDKNRVRIDNALIYSSKPVDGLKANEIAEKNYPGNLKK